MIFLAHCRKSCGECESDNKPDPQPAKCVDYRTDCSHYKDTCTSDPKFMSGILIPKI